MGFDVQMRMSRNVYDWVNKRGEENPTQFSQCNIRKAGAYFVASAAHLGLLLLTPITIALDIFWALTWIFFGIVDRDCDSFKNVATCLAQATGGALFYTAQNVLGIFLPFAADWLNYTYTESDFNKKMT